MAAKVQQFSDIRAKEGTFYSKDDRISGFPFGACADHPLILKSLEKISFPGKNIRLSQYVKDRFISAFSRICFSALQMFIFAEVGLQIRPNGENGLVGLDVFIVRRCPVAILIVADTVAPGSSVGRPVELDVCCARLDFTINAVIIIIRGACRKPASIDS